MKEADDILLSSNLSHDELKQYDAVKNKFEDHFIAKRKVLYERAKFNVRIQNDGEPVESFITDLHCLAELCDFGTLKDQLIRDRIIQKNLVDTTLITWLKVYPVDRQVAKKRSTFINRVVNSVNLLVEPNARVA